MEDFSPTKDSSPLPYAASFARLFVLLAFVCSAAVGIATDDEAEEEETLSKETLEALEEFTSKAAESKLKRLTSSVKKSVDQLAEELSLDEATKKKLAEHAPKILEGTQREWRKKFEKQIKGMLQNYPNPPDILKQWKPKSFASSNQYGLVSPEQTDEWSAALEATLPEETFTAYKKAAEEKIEKLRAELKDYFIRCEEMAANQMRTLLDTETELLKQLIDLDEKRSKDLEETATLAINATVDTWIVEWKESVYAMGDSQREQHTKHQAYPSLDLANKQNPKKHKKWKEGMAKIFTEEELGSAKKRRTNIRNTRAEALAMVLIDELQPFIGFTIEQRAKFTKQFAKPLHKLPDHYFVQQGNGGYYSIDAGQMFKLVTKNAKEDILPTLIGGQVKRWIELDQQSLSSNRYYSSGGPVKGLVVPPAKEIDAVEAQRLITAYMHLKAKDTMATHLTKMEAKVDAVVRVGELDDKKTALLRTAGKGAAQILAKGSIENMERRARQQFQNVEPADLPARLVGNNSHTYYSHQQAPADPTIWTQTIDRLLSEEQKKSWEKEADAGKRWSTETKQAILMSEIDKNIPLPPKKRDGLEKLVAGVLNDYGAEIGNMLSHQWHIQGYYGLVPLSILTEKELGTVLEKSEIELLRSRDPGHFEGMLGQLKSSRKQRLKNEKKLKKKK